MYLGRRVGIVILCCLVVVGIAGIGYVWLRQQQSIDNIPVGHFNGELVLKPMSDGRFMELFAPYSYVDGQGEPWDVPAGAKVDGASIPKPLWSTIGGPFEGKYRNASVIHDYYCDTKTRSWEATHRVFYEAMLANGVDLKLAQLMFYAVYRFGPRWEFEMALNHSGYSGPVAYSADFDEDELKSAAEAINSGDVQLSKLLAQAKAERLRTDTRGDSW